MTWPFRRRTRPSSFDQHADQALTVAAPSATRLVLDHMDVELGIADLKVAWALDPFLPPHERPPISPGPTSLSTEEH